MTDSLKQIIKNRSRQLGFILAGFTSCEPPTHFEIFKNWLGAGCHGTMEYLADERSRLRRANPKLILPECESILLLGIPYHATLHPRDEEGYGADNSVLVRHEETARAQIAAYAWGNDYHEILLQRMQELVTFIEGQIGRPVPHRCYTDTGPILERDLAWRAGLGWIGKNACLVNPHHGSCFLLAEILLGIAIEPDAAFDGDYCGTCTRCIAACPTHCIQPDRTLDARHCISYLTIELKEDIPVGLRSLLRDWVFGCDVCQMVCPWNRFADKDGDPAFRPHADTSFPTLTDELHLASQTFNNKFRRSPIKRSGRRGYLRNIVVALGNCGNEGAIPALRRLLDDPEPMIREHAQWAIKQIERRAGEK